MIRKAIKFIGIALLLYLLFCLATPFIPSLKERSIKNQIHYLSKILDGGYDNTLQQRFPEGKLFSNALLALSVIEYCDSNQKSDTEYAEIVDHCVMRIQSQRATQNFNKDLNPEYGIFYCGWSNLVYSRYLSSEIFAHSQVKAEVIAESQKIVNEITQIQCDSSRILRSYSGGSWPADNLIAISSLKDETLKRNWIETLLERSDHKSGLINHSDGEPSIIRGSSSALLTYCLDQSGYEKIAEYNANFQSIFIDTYLGIELVKENADGSNRMDYDSGPVVFGYGASATIMNIKAQASLGNSRSKVTWAAMNTIAAPINFCGKKFYLLKQEPMLDLFLLWGCVEL